jgi:hypothetical protein
VIGFNVFTGGIAFLGMKYVEGKCGISIFATQSTPNPHKAKHVLNSVYTRVSFLISYVYILSVI